MRRAHTLMELLVVLSLLSLSAGIVVPRFISSWDSAQLNAAASAMRSDFAFAQARAASTGLRHQVLIDNSTGELLVQPFRPEEMTQAATSQVAQSVPVLQDTVSGRVKVLKWQVEPFGYTSGTTTTPDTTVLTFYPEGRSDNALLVLESAAGQQRGVQVDGYTGEVRELNAQEIQDWQGRPAGGQ